MAGPGMAVMTGGGIIPIGTVQIVTLVTHCGINRQTAMRRGAVRPGLPGWHLAASFTKVTLGTTDTGKAALVVGTVAGGALGDILGRRNPMERSTVLVQPGLAGRMVDFGMTIVATLRGKAKASIYIMTTIADSH